MSDSCDEIETRIQAILASIQSDEKSNIIALTPDHTVF